MTTPRSRPASARLLVVALLLAAVSNAAVPDHLTCYKVRDAQQGAKYTADLAGLAAEPGCSIHVPARIACVPSTKTNVQSARMPGDPPRSASMPRRRPSEHGPAYPAASEPGLADHPVTHGLRRLHDGGFAASQRRFDPSRPRAA